ncbi:MAG TPA: cytochrome c oxidase subunit II [Oxalicibacterium sp.]|nr:cytochrome c oxidase subunit II [Oxalicibacterium sp.]
MMNGRARTLRAIGLLLPLTACRERGYVQSALHPAGADALIISDMAWLLFGGGALIFIFVMLLLARGVSKRQRAVRPAVWIAGLGFVFPVTVLSALLAYGVLRSRQLTPPLSHDALVISVTARMWWWEVRYRGDASGKDIALANEIHIPVGRPVYIALGSDDVIHSFWVPALAGKVDTIPGRLTRLRVQADRAGVFRGQCAEYCGAQHARMAFHVVAQEPAAFDAWLANQARPALPADSALLQRGREVFVERRCSACHAIRGVREESIAGRTLGPDLTHVGSRMFIAAGTLRNDRRALRDWIGNAQHLKRGARMPSFQEIGDEDLHALSSYLEHLK